nr:polygalacturonase-1 non-catalytic subunit beta [Quercus suber]
MASLFLFIFLTPLTVGSASDQNPLSQESYLIRYWNKQTGNSHTKPVFLLSKASPLSAVESASFSKLASTHNHSALSSRFSAFCASANLLCFPDSSLITESHRRHLFKILPATPGHRRPEIPYHRYFLLGVDVKERDGDANVGH